jgi:hypothetical protein
MAIYRISHVSWSKTPNQLKSTLLPQNLSAPSSFASFTQLFAQVVMMKASIIIISSSPPSFV